MTNNELYPIIKSILSNILLFLIVTIMVIYLPLKLIKYTSKYTVYWKYIS